MDKTVLTAFFVCVCLLTGCKKTSKQVEMEVPQSVIGEVELLSNTPDSLLTPDQLSKKVNICLIIKETLKIDGDKLVTTATIEDFERKGLAKGYYSYYLKNLDEINSNMDYSPGNIQETYDRMIRELETEIKILAD